MSYAEAAKRGPQQTPEEAAAPPVPQLERTIDTEQSLIDVDSPHVSSVPSNFEDQSVKTSTQADRINLEEKDAKRRAEREADEARQALRRGKNKAQTLFERTKQNADNPVVIGNAVAIAALAAVFGTVGYRRWEREGFSWGLVGIGAGVAAVFGAVDFVVSRWGFQKYPPK